MQGIRAVFFAASGIALLALAALFTASLTVALLGVLAMTGLARMVSARLKPVPVKAASRNSGQGRIWNDGRGTIIDL